MKISTSLKINNLKIIQPEVFADARGEFVETFNKEKYQFRDADDKIIDFVEDDFSVSKKNVLHGLHGDDITFKLIQCVYGEVFFVVADMRKNSSTYLQCETFLLNDKNRLQILVPAGCVNGHLCLTEKCIFAYKQSQYYSGSKKQISVRWDEPKLNIDWTIKNPILSERDASSSYLK